MKKVLFLAGAALLSLSVSAQNSKIKQAENMLILKQWDEAKKSIDEALQHEKTKDEPMTYVTAADVYISLAANGNCDDCLAKSLEFYNKAIELDAIGGPKGKKVGKYAKKIQQAKKELVAKAGEAAAAAYSNKDYKKSLECFLAQDSLSGDKLDTVLFTNIGITAMQAEMFSVGAEYFLKAARLMKTNANASVDDGVLAYRRAKYCYDQLKDSANVEKSIKEGFEAYPQSSDIVTELINYYLQAQKNNEALVYLNDAISKDPNNAQYFFARGCLNEKNSFEAAEADYKTAIGLNGELFNAYYNLAVLYYNKSLEIKTNASAERDMAKYNAMMAESKEVMAKAAPYFEKAADYATTKELKYDVLSNLQKTYYNIGEYNKSSEVKARIDAL